MWGLLGSLVKRPYGRSAPARIGSGSPSWSWDSLVCRAVEWGSLTCGRRDEAEPLGLRGGGAPAGRTQLGQHRRDVVVHGLGGDDERGGDLRVGAAGADQVEDLVLAPGEA